MKSRRVEQLHDRLHREAIDSLNADQLEAFLLPLDRWSRARRGRTTDALSLEELERAAAGGEVAGFTTTPPFAPERLSEAPDGSLTWQGHFIATAEEWARFRAVCGRLGWSIPAGTGAVA